VPWQGVTAGDVTTLRGLAERASPAGRAHVEPALSAALDSGTCALALRAAIEAGDQDAAADVLYEAQRLGLEDLESAEQRLRALRPPAPAANSAPPLQARPGWAWHPGEAYNEPLYGQDNLIFLDLELTAGFYEFDEKPVILESAVIITDKDLNEKARGQWVVGGFKQEELDSLSEFHQVHFRDANPGGSFPPRVDSRGGNGLFTDVMSSQLTTPEVEASMLALIQRHCRQGSCPLVGYSVQCDREVLKEEMPRLYRYVSHRIVDVSSIFHMARLWLPEKTRIRDASTAYRHRALNDVEDSLDALRWARKHLFQQRRQPAPLPI